MQDTGCRIRLAGCRIRVAGCRRQDTGCRIQDAGYRMQDTGYRLNRNESPGLGAMWNLILEEDDGIKPRVRSYVELNHAKHVMTE